MWRFSYYPFSLSTTHFSDLFSDMHSRYVCMYICMYACGPLRSSAADLLVFSKDLSKITQGVNVNPLWPVFLETSAEDLRDSTSVVIYKRYPKACLCSLVFTSGALSSFVAIACSSSSSLFIYSFVFIYLLTFVKYYSLQHFGLHVSWVLRKKFVCLFVFFILTHRPAYFPLHLQQQIEFAWVVALSSGLMLVGGSNIVSGWSLALDVNTYVFCFVFFLFHHTQL